MHGKPQNGHTEGDKRLESWKEIAAHFGRDVRTVQRWEMREGLPVHRHLHDKLSTVYAHRSELDSWWHARKSILVTEKAEAPPARRVRRMAFMLLITALSISGSLAVWKSRSPAASSKAVPELVPLTTLPGSEIQPSFSPDASQVVFAWKSEQNPNYDIHVKTIGSDVPLRLTGHPADELGPTWSPSGRWIAFLRISGAERAELLLVPPTGGSARRIAEIAFCIRGSNLVDDLIPAWSADEKWLVVSDKSSPAAPFTLYRISVETGEKRRLTAPPLGTWGDTAPAISPDGRSLVFARTAGLLGGELFLLRLGPDAARSGEPVRIADGVRFARRPFWSSDGKQIFFSRHSSGHVDLWRLNFGKPGRPERVALRSGHLHQPALSRRGHRLAFASWVFDTDIYNIKFSGPSARGNPVKLVASTQMDSSPQWSPDASRIAFGSRRSGNEEIWICDADGANAIQLTSLRAPVTGTPRWSPDGNNIAFDSNASGQLQLYIVPSQGGSPRRLSSTSHDCSPSWSRDGNWILFGSNRGGDFQVWKIPPGGGQAVQVTRQGGHVAFESPDGQFLYYTKEHLGDSALWRVPAAGGEEVEVIGLVKERAFAVTNDAVYYMAPSKDGHQTEIRRLEIRSRLTKSVARLEHSVGMGLALSPDAGSLLFTQVDHIDQDLVLVDGFR